MFSLRITPRTCRRFISTRAYSNVPPSSKPPLELVAELRKRTAVSISKAREALIASSNNLDQAVEWLDKDLAESGAKKAEKVQDREAKEGVISIGLLRSVPSVRAAMIELNCETDFVGRNELFQDLAANIAHTAAFLVEQKNSVGTPGYIRPWSVSDLYGAPLIPRENPVLNSTTPMVGEAIQSLVAKVGEKISLRRVAVLVCHPLIVQDIGLRVASYTHGFSGSSSQGRIGALALMGVKASRISALLQTPSFTDSLERLERAVARQIVGFDTRSIGPGDGVDSEAVLYSQPFMMFGEEGGQKTVRDVLDGWGDKHGVKGVEVLEFAKWTVGEEY